MNQLLNDIGGAWSGLSRGRRALLAVAALALLTAVIVAGVWALRTDYRVLFADLAPRDAAALVGELKRMKVEYRVAEGGSKILVDERLVHDTRLQLMGRGVPLAGGVGFEIFDNRDIGMTEYTQKINYQRALQGELARTITAISTVRRARVHLVLAETSLFKRRKVEPKASVSVVLKEGAFLTAAQIAGIQRLVSASVPGLTPGAVTVLNELGVALSPVAAGAEDYAHATGKLRLKKDAEDYFIRKITAVLDRTFGPGRAIVSVNVRLNFDEVRQTRQTVLPVRTEADEGAAAGAVVRKRHSVYRDGKGAVTRTVNGEAYAGASPALTSTTDVEYELGRAVEQVISSPGGVRRVSVGVVVPAMQPDQLERIQEIVRMIIGYDAGRGDAIAVQSIDRLLAEPGDLVPASEPAAAPEASPPAAPGAATPAAPENAPRLPALLARMSPEMAATLPYVLVAGIGMLVAVIVAAAHRRRRTGVKGAAHAGLSDAQRNARLAEIQAWLAAERSKGLGLG